MLGGLMTDQVLTNRFQIVMIRGYEKVLLLLILLILCPHCQHHLGRIVGKTRLHCHWKVAPIARIAQGVGLILQSGPLVLVVFLTGFDNLANDQKLLQRFRYERNTELLYRLDIYWI